MWHSDTGDMYDIDGHGYINDLKIFLINLILTITRKLIALRFIYLIFFFKGFPQYILGKLGNNEQVAFQPLPSNWVKRTSVSNLVPEDKQVNVHLIAS